MVGIGKEGEGSKGKGEGGAVVEQYFTLADEGTVIP